MPQPLIDRGNGNQFQIQPYIMIVEQHITEKVIVPSCQRETKVIEKLEYVPIIEQKKKWKYITL